MDSLLCIMLPELEDPCRQFYRGAGRPLVEMFTPELVANIRDRMTSMLDTAVARSHTA
jgi:hypothetical protein